MNCKYCKAECGFSGERRERDCKGYITMTNADRFRAMSDEELAHELAMVAGWDREQYKKAKAIGIEKVMLDWLRKSAEGE